MLLHFYGMRLQTIDEPGTNFAKTNCENHAPESATSVDSHRPRYILDEINGYIAIRDMRVAEVEQAATAENMRRASVANEFVETCLKPPQAVYAAQHLPEPAAAFERKRCEVVRARIAELRASCSSGR